MHTGTSPKSLGHCVLPVAPELGSLIACIAMEGTSIDILAVAVFDGRTSNIAAEHFCCSGLCLLSVAREASLLDHRSHRFIDAVNSVRTD